MITAPVMKGLIFFKPAQTDQMCFKVAISKHFKRQPHKMAEHSQANGRLLLTNCLSVFHNSV